MSFFANTQMTLSVAFLPNASGGDQKDDLFVVNTIDDAVSLAGDAHAIVAVEFGDEGFAILFRVFSKTVNRLDDFCPNARVRLIVRIDARIVKSD